MFEILKAQQSARTALDQLENLLPVLDANGLNRLVILAEELQKTSPQPLQPADNLQESKKKNDVV
jgi:hypothetical protein